MNYDNFGRLTEENTLVIGTSPHTGVQEIIHRKLFFEVIPTDGASHTIGVIIPPNVSVTAGISEQEYIDRAIQNYIDGHMHGQRVYKVVKKSEEYS